MCTGSSDIESTASLTAVFGSVLKMASAEPPMMSHRPPGACKSHCWSHTHTNLHDTLIQKLLDDFDDEPEAMDWFKEY